MLQVAINPVACDDGDHCTTHDRCDIKTGQCYGIPKKCHGECQMCDTEHGCKNKCEDGEVCKHGKCAHEEEEPEAHKPECTKGGHECDACHKCFFGKCVPKSCPKGKQCVVEGDKATCVVKSDDCPGATRLPEAVTGPAYPPGYEPPHGVARSTCPMASSVLL